jgi:ubiquitin-protein ligase
MTHNYTQSRRLINESLKILESENEMEDNISYFLTKNDVDDFRFVLFIGEKKKYNIKFEFPRCYPFKVPKVFIINNNEEVIVEYLKSLKDIKFPGISKCLCCESIICSNNWYPGLNVISIMEEIKKNYTQLRKNIIDLCCNSIIKQKLGIYSHSFLEYKIIQKYLY